MSPVESDLGTAELEVLKTLWETGPATVREVMNRLHGRGRTVAYTTVLTFLSRLEQTRFVKSDRSGIAYVYRAVVSRERVSRSRLRALLEELYDGSAAPLVLQLMRDERFTREEVDELQRLVDDLDATARPPAGKAKGRSSGRKRGDSREGGR